MKKYDVIVIGSGGGAKITSPAASAGYKVASIEKDRMGGTCLNRGCIPSKMLIHPADVAIEIKEAHRFDIRNNPQFAVDFAKLVTRISDTVDGDSDKIVASYTKHPNIDLYQTTARFVAPKIVEVGGEQITADKIVIAVGCRPKIPDIPGLEGTPYMTSTEALRATKLPKSMIVIGGGFIGAELGHAYGALGCETHFLIRNTMLKSADSEIGKEFERIFCRNHKVYFNANATRVAYAGNQFTVTYQKDGAEHTLSSEALLIATGITPNTDTLNLETSGIKVNPNGYIIVDDYLQTTVRDVYAIGDCIGRYFFRHSVNFEGEYLFRSLYQDDFPNPIVYPPVPYAVFTHPQIAGVGKTEDELKKDGIEYVAGVNAYRSSAMGMALLSDHGFCKILIERSSRRILGAHIIGPEASNMIHMIIAFMNKEGTLDDLLNMIYIHPALPEIVRNTARKAQGAFEKNVVRV